MSKDSAGKSFYNNFYSEALRPFLRFFKHFLLRMLGLVSNRWMFTFVNIFGLFGNSKSVSGPGSDLEATRVVRPAIASIIKKYNIQSILDAPCGDFLWMNQLDLTGINYLGVDLVARQIKNNSVHYGSGEKTFKVLDVVNENVPKVDLIICRDLLVHLTNGDALKVLSNFVDSGSSYLLITSFPDHKTNHNLELGFFRPINLQIAPFGLMSPIEIINEECLEGNGEFQDKSMLLYELAGLKISK